MNQQLKNSYSFFDKCKLVYWLIKTKLLWPKARIIRFPFTLRGRRFVNLGCGLTTGHGCRIEAFSQDGDKSIKLFLGKNVQINDYVHLCALQSVRIGNQVLLASHVYISDNSHGCYKGTKEDASPDTAPIHRDYHIASVEIGDNVWIGEGAIILPGVTIGFGSIIGAHSVVNRNVPPECIVAGVPARIIKKYDRIKRGWYKTDSEGNFI